MQGTNVTISVCALSVMVDHPPSIMQSLAPPIWTCIMLSTILSQALLLPLLRRAYTPKPSSFRQGRCIVSTVIMLEQGWLPILLVLFNTLEILPHTKPMVLVSSHVLVPLSSTYSRPQ